ncbi:MAG TPA: ATP synthase F1 subunit gamma [Fimbriimonadales bacterium]|jgi:F-type H+-transporting ATPase subunit gamma|nr:ATP synthase F1 subunit gamma [Fimbriimonadales bacterium]
MATIKQLRRRIRSAKSIQQITRAMKLVAAARLRRAQDRVLEARPYSEEMRNLMSSMAAGGDMPSHPLLERRPVEKYGVILFTAERGLAGSFNTNLIRRANDFMAETPGEKSLIGVGKKGSQFFMRRRFDVIETVNVPTSGPTIEHARQITARARDLFESGAVDAIYLVYSKFHSAIRQTPEVVQLLPIEPPVAGEGSSTESFTKTYSFEPDATELLGQLLPRYALTLVLQALLESTASEHGARMTAMTSATDNAGEMIQDLTLQANRMRQASITKEILEIVGGAEALKG